MTDREAFEAWAKQTKLPRSDIAWEAWQAACKYKDEQAAALTRTVE